MQAQALIARYEKEREKLEEELGEEQMKRATLLSEEEARHQKELEKLEERASLLTGELASARQEIQRLEAESRQMKLHLQAESRQEIRRLKAVYATRMREQHKTMADEAAQITRQAIRDALLQHSFGDEISFDDEGGEDAADVGAGVDVGSGAEINANPATEGADAGPPENENADKSTNLTVEPDNGDGADAPEPEGAFEK